MQQKTRYEKLTLITRGNEPLMQFARDVLGQLTIKGRRLDIITHFTGDVSYDADAIPLFIYDESRMCIPGYHSTVPRRSTFLTVGSSETLFTQLQMAPITWAPKARICIALWPIKPENLDDVTRRRFALVLGKAVRGARKKLTVLSHQTGSGVKEPEFPAMNRPSPDYILALEERHGIIGS